jgi:hypothetical protein
METRTVTLIQFIDGIEYTCGYDEVSRGMCYYVINMDSSDDFFMGEDDEGDERYDSLDCIDVCDSLEDLNGERNIYSVASRGLIYSTITMELPVDEDGNIVFNAA